MTDQSTSFVLAFTASSIISTIGFTFFRRQLIAYKGLLDPMQCLTTQAELAPTTMLNSNPPSKVACQFKDWQGNKIDAFYFIISETERRHAQAEQRVAITYLRSNPGVNSLTSQIQKSIQTQKLIMLAMFQPPLVLGGLTLYYTYFAG